MKKAEIGQPRFVCTQFSPIYFRNPLGKKKECGLNGRHSGCIMWTGPIYDVTMGTRARCIGMGILGQGALRGQS
jgi:hypothetical protein